MLTIFSIPKAFVGETGALQSTAVASWAALDPNVQVVLVGEDEGVAAAAQRLGVEHVAAAAPTSGRPPRLDEAFAEVDALARHPLRCFVNGDVVLFPDLVPAASSAGACSPSFLLVGQTLDLDPALVAGRSSGEQRDAAYEHGRRRGPAAIDWFVFPAGLFDPMPPFLVGRAAFDNWMIWKARQLGPVIDATEAVLAIHQSHGYDHLQGGKDEAYYGAEAAHNLELAGGKRHVYTLHDASHHMRVDLSIRRNPGSILRVGETARKIRWKLGLR